MRTLEAVLCISIAVLASACERSQAPIAQPPAVSAPSAPAALPARVTAIELGTAIGSDGRVAAGAGRTTFSPSDTIYVSIQTERSAPGATLSARWTFEDGQLVSEGRETVASSDRAATEFHIAKPDGWPAGRYRVEVALNDQPAGAREFEVR